MTGERHSVHVRTRPRGRKPVLHARREYLHSATQSDGVRIHGHRSGINDVRHYHACHSLSLSRQRPRVSRFERSSVTSTALPPASSRESAPTRLKCPTQILQPPRALLKCLSAAHRRKRS